MKKECFFGAKTFSSFKIGSLPNWEGAKYAGGSRPSCIIFLIKVIVPTKKTIKAQKFLRLYLKLKKVTKVFLDSALIEHIPRMKDCLKMQKH